MKMKKMNWMKAGTPANPNTYLVWLVLWCGVVGVVWCGRCGVVWCGVVWFGVVGVVWCGWCGVVWLVLYGVDGVV